MHFCTSTAFTREPPFSHATACVGLPDRGGRVPLVPPLLGRVDVHAPQLPVVAVARVLIALHLERVVLDVVDGGEDDPLAVFFDSGQNRLGPDRSVDAHKHTRAHLTDTNFTKQMLGAVL